MPDALFPRHLVFAGAPFGSHPASIPAVRDIQSAFCNLFDHALDGALAKGEVTLHWFDDVDELIRELTGLYVLVGDSPKDVGFVLFSTQGHPTQLERKVNSLELHRDYIVSPKVMAYRSDEWQTIASLARRPATCRSFIMHHQRNPGLVGPALFALQVRSDYDPSDLDGLRDYLIDRPERETLPPPPAPTAFEEADTEVKPLPPVVRKERGDATIRYATPERPSQLMRAVVGTPEHDPNASTQEIPMDVIERAKRPK